MIYSKRSKWAIIILYVSLLTLINGCESKAPIKPLKPIRVQLVWTHQSQFAGLYAADQKGYYAAEGLKVNFIPRSKPSSNVFLQVVQGKADFGIGHGVGLVTSRDQGLPVQAIACIYRYYALVFITLKSSKIEKPQDFPGHSIRALTPGGAAIAFRAMMSRLGLDAQSVRQIKVGYNFDLFLSGKVDIWPGYATNEVLLARKRGVAVNRILPSDYGVHLYGDTLFTTHALIREKPDMVLRFLRASLKGWQWALENAEIAGPMALSYDPDLDAAHQIALLSSSIPLINPGKMRIGWMQPDLWGATQKILIDQKIIKHPVKLNEVFTNYFLKQIYPKAE